MPNDDAPITETELRERQDVLVRALSVEQNSERLQAYSDELEAVQRQLEQVRSR